MQFEFIPRKGAGPIEFGMGVEQVRRLINEPHRSFKRTSLAAHPLDQFESAGLFVNYDAAGLVEALEFDDTADLTMNGLSLQGLSPQSAKNLIRNAGARFKESEDGVVSIDLGLSFWFPDKAEEPNAPAKSVLAFRDGYFD